jgi:hypothetical protein
MSLNSASARRKAADRCAGVRENQARLGGGRWKSAESRGLAGSRPRDLIEATENVSDETSPMNNTGSIAISCPDALLRSIDEACR